MPDLCFCISAHMEDARRSPNQSHPGWYTRGNMGGVGAVPAFFLLGIQDSSGRTLMSQVCRESLMCLTRPQMSRCLCVIIVKFQRSEVLFQSIPTQSHGDARCDFFHLLRRSGHLGGSGCCSREQNPKTGAKQSPWIFGITLSVTWRNFSYHHVRSSRKHMNVPGGKGNLFSDMYILCS